MGEKVHLTGQAAFSRVAKLEDNANIERYTIKVNKVKLDSFIHAFITIITQSTYNQPFLLIFLKKKTKL